MSVQTIRHVVIHGRVQGVGYRVFTEYAALDRGLAGWVRNRRDGAVEAVFAGPPEAVAAVIEACRRGPPGARSTRSKSARNSRRPEMRGREIRGVADGIAHVPRKSETRHAYFRKGHAPINESTFHIAAMLRNAAAVRSAARRARVRNARMQRDCRAPSGGSAKERPTSSVPGGAMRRRAGRPQGRS